VAAAHLMTRDTASSTALHLGLPDEVAFRS
jgi:hypothetical protein